MVSTYTPSLTLSFAGVHGEKMTTVYLLCVSDDDNEKMMTVFVLCVG